jgi:rhamnosyltransferase
MISIIIRTKNEEKWIVRTLRQLKKQTYSHFEIILVDNNSTDKTVERAIKEYPQLKLITINDFLPGLAINIGIEEAKGDFISILSAHCIPVNKNWLEKLHSNFSNKNIAGVYGRQVPMKFTSSADKRDLLVTFGLDKRIQVKDSFFHNANSMIRKNIWEKIPFDSKATNIEDRIWGKKIIESGYHIVYDPEAAVYHHHGIHQNNNEARLKNVVKIMEDLALDVTNNKSKIMDENNNEVLCLIPVKYDKSNYKIISNLLNKTIETVKKSKLINRFMVVSDNKILSDKAISLGAESPFIRPKKLSSTNTRVDDVLGYSINKIEKDGYYPDIIVSLEIIYPFRPDDLIDKMILELIEKGLDSVVAGFPEYRIAWSQNENDFKRIDDFNTAKELRNLIHIANPGLGSVAYPNFIRNNSRIGGKVGIHEIDNQLSFLKVDNELDIENLISLQNQI